MLDLSEKLMQGDRLALSRMITRIENGDPDHHEIFDRLFPHSGRAHIIGITGPSGSGKSTLVNRLALYLVENNENDLQNQVGIIAVDPTSPFTGGALLGDRVRMRDLAAHPCIFIRSMATRGALGGLARAADSAAWVLDAAGFNTIIIETVGAGQSEVEIARLAHTTIVVEAPGLGDDIQAAKAGILEIADILVVNKSDKSGAETTAQSLKAMLTIGVETRQRDGMEAENHWTVPVLMTSSLEGEGIEALADTVTNHREYLINSGTWRERSQARVRDLLENLLRDALFASWRNSVGESKLEAIIRRVADHELSPNAAVRELLE